MCISAVVAFDLGGAVSLMPHYISPPDGALCELCLEPFAASEIVTFVDGACSLPLPRFVKLHIPTGTTWSSFAVAYVVSPTGYTQARLDSAGDSAAVVDSIAGDYYMEYNGSGNYLPITSPFEGTTVDFTLSSPFIGTLSASAVPTLHFFSIAIEIGCAGTFRVRLEVIWKLATGAHYCLFRLYDPDGDFPVYYYELPGAWSTTLEQLHPYAGVWTGPKTPPWLGTDFGTTHHTGGAEDATIDAVTI